MSTETTSSQGIIQRQSRPWQRLARRYDIRRSRHRHLPWLGYTLTTINIVILAFLVFDTPLGQAAKNLSPRLIEVAGAVTDIGRLAWILAIIAVVFAVGLFVARRSPTYGRYRAALLIRMVAYVGLSVLTTSFIVNLLKYAIGRARPLLYDQYGIVGFAPFHGDFLFESFPSAHSANVGALFGALALLFPRFRLLFIGIGIWLGASRIIIGVHYPSDVAAGLALGAWIAFAVAVLFSRFGLVFSTGQDAWPRPRLNRGLR
ncbi:phosphatase PAP2 family protein [Rhizobium leucaenae]|uniref:Undecaprenyl-diphosphatase n=1 Tax=Rhizobium leucaenae TaxID=29450 RepID=A0A7W6ZX36_9HYPH|nr:phosphatase PAP2 family protein [Rhizobium leucaenae]MBB4570369.1 undecaprenyl-diphosphatase [Rhizobium leucaenae]MBB6301055.1 undecaprenyl-diphosphatase [Rhizobium leucaenae]